MTDWFIRPQQHAAPVHSATGTWRASTVLRVALMALLSVPRGTTDASFDPYFSSSLTATLNGHALNQTEVAAFFNAVAAQAADGSSLHFSAFEDIPVAGVCASADPGTNQGAASVQFALVGSGAQAPARNISMTVCAVTSDSGTNELSVIQFLSPDAI